MINNGVEKIILIFKMLSEINARYFNYLVHISYQSFIILVSCYVVTVVNK